MEEMKLIILNSKGWTKEFCLQDSDFRSDFIFNCPNCKKINFIDAKNSTSYPNIGLKFTQNEIDSIGGTGTISKLIDCVKCKTIYFVGIGYIEPNNGRDVLVLHNIVELDNIKIQEIIEHICDSAFNNKISELKYLLTLPIDINSNGRNWSILHSAIENQNYECVKLILEKGADYELKGNCDMTPLEHSIDISIDSNNNTGGKPGDESTKIIKLLLEFGARPETGIEIAKSYKSKKITELLASY